MKASGFVKFQRKLNKESKEKKNGKDLFLAEKRLGGELYTRYEGLLKLVDGEYDWSDYVGWCSRAGYTKRQTPRVSDRIFCGELLAGPMGLYFDVKCSVDEAIEHILKHSSGQ